MAKFTVKLEPFVSDDNHYYLKINGRVVAALLPSDFVKIAEVIPTTRNTRAFVKDAVEAYYIKKD